MQLDIGGATRIVGIEDEQARAEFVREGSALARKPSRISRTKQIAAMSASKAHTSRNAFHGFMFDSQLNEIGANEC
jgi:hypothetical protein